MSSTLLRPTGQHAKIPFLYIYKLECFIGISTTEKNCITTLKNDDNFLRHGICNGQSIAYTVLALFSAMSERQRVRILFLKREC